MSVVQIDSSKHVVKQTQASLLFQRVLHTPDIFTYFNVETGVWVLAYWLHRQNRLADELEDLGAAFECMTPRLVEDITRCWGPVDWGKKKRAMLAREKRREDKRNEAVIEDQERWDWLRKRTKDKSPVPYAYYPSIKGGQ
jgi:hypothetical protein